MKKFVAYFRVSTAKQGKSGLGLESKKTMVNNYLSNIFYFGLVSRPTFDS